MIMKRFELILISLFVLFLYNCKDDNKNENTDLIKISGITEVDINRQLVGSFDTTDWRLDDKWSSIEENLFSKKTVSGKKSVIGVLPISYFKVNAYPNPFTSYIMFDFGLNSNSFCDLRIVDSKLNIILSCDSIRNKIELDLSSAKYKNKMYRSYYKIFYNNTIYRGHGDIKIN